MNNGEGFFCQTIFKKKIKIFHMIKTTNLLLSFFFAKTYIITLTRYEYELSNCLPSEKYVCSNHNFE